MKRYAPVLPLIAKYPFLRITGKFLEKEYSSVESVFEKRGMIEREAISLAIEKVRSSTKNEEFNFKLDLKKLDWPMPCFSCERDCVDCDYLKKLDFLNCNACGRCFENCHYNFGYSIHELKAIAKKSAIYHLALRAMMQHLSPVLRRRISTQEARDYRHRLEKELENERYEVVTYVASDLGVISKGVEKIHVSSYLKGAVRIRDENWRLVNRKIESGWVEVSGKEFVRLLEEFIKIKLEKVISAKLPAEIINEIRGIAFREESLKIDVPVKLEFLPPCMKKIISDLQNGVNVPHTARFAITSFLLNIGMSVDEIVKLFSNSPDFDEEKTRYQVEHIAGMRGKGAEYTCPSCETMRTYHNCVADCGVSSPLSYYAKRVKKLKKT